MSFPWKIWCGKAAAMEKKLSWKSRYYGILIFWQISSFQKEILLESERFLLQAMFLCDADLCEQSIKC